MKLLGAGVFPYPNLISTDLRGDPQSVLNLLRESLTLNPSLMWGEGREIDQDGGLDVPKLNSW